ncbi:septum formation initiator family protein [Sporosarcina thermotolerans]|uniref:Septum formation initiator family protein n=1 Tax=Sporosarcina thermotolerans TaxID=633404 RepID=A0AAW9AEW6_9BACL|nr:septum formation initiator family protein [Sporosarcina thermotolerans]MDW0118705.1 septum formation initiator family protein [Sporosarcina thermotolerans]WHT48651.1 septum formation initiator family protein [Sporosarcina thermotolerans]
MEQRKRKPSATVASIETDYVRSLRKKEIWKNKQKKRLQKKLFIYAVIAFVLFGGLTSMYIQQKQTLQDKELEKKEMLAQLEQVNEEQDLLKKQLVKLDDEEYIAKLARKEYFLSDENEIIFSVPEKKKKSDEKDDGKE